MLGKISSATALVGSYNMTIQFSRKNSSGLALQLLFLVFAAVLFYVLKDYSINNQNERTWPLVRFVANSVLVSIMYYGFIIYEFIASIRTYCRSPDVLVMSFSEGVVTFNNKSYETKDLTCLVEGSWLIFRPKNYRYALCLVKGKKRVFTSRPYFNDYPKQEVTKLLSSQPWADYQEER